MDKTTNRRRNMNRMSILHAAVAVFVFTGLFSAPVAFGAWTGAVDNDWRDTANWEDTDDDGTGEIDGKIFLIGSTVELQDQDSPVTFAGQLKMYANDDSKTSDPDNWSAPSTFDIYDDFTVSDSSDHAVRIGTDSNSSTNEMHVRGSSTFTNQGTLNLGTTSGNKQSLTIHTGSQLDQNSTAYLGASYPLTQGGGHGVLNVEDGAKADFSDWLNLGYFGTTNAVVNARGDISVGSGIQVGRNGDSEFNVHGNWHEFNEPLNPGSITADKLNIGVSGEGTGTLRYYVEDGGATKITVNEANFANAVLDLQFLDDPVTWEGEVLRWNDSLSNEGNLTLAGTADSDIDYSIEYDSGSSGAGGLYLTAVPEPSSLLLLALGSLLLMKPRRRRA